MKNKKREEYKHHYLLLFGVSSCIILFSRDGEVKTKSKLSPLTEDCDGVRKMGAEWIYGMVSAGIGSYQTILSYVPSTSAFNSSLQPHHPGFMVHQSSKLAGSMWGLRTESLWTVSHSVSPSASVLVTFPKEDCQDFPESPDPAGK